MDTDIKFYPCDDQCTTKRESIDIGHKIMAIGFDFNLLPDNVYVNLINYLSVNDIDHLGESGLDDRTEMAFLCLRHPMIYAENGQELVNHWFPKLPNTIKTIDVCFRQGWKEFLTDDLMVTMGRQFPHLEKLPEAVTIDCLEYAQSRKSPHSKLKKIGRVHIYNQRDAEKTRRLVSLCPRLKEVDIEFSANLVSDDQFVDILPKCYSLEKLTLSVYRFDDKTNAYWMKLISSLPSLKLVTLFNWTDDEFALRFLTFCTQQKFKTEKISVTEHATQLDEQFRQFVTKLKLNSVNGMQLISRLKNFTNLREIPIHLWKGTSEILLALCDDQIASKPVTIPFFNAHLSTEDEMNSFKQFLEVRGNQVKEMSLSVEPPIASRLMKMLGNLANLRFTELAIHIFDFGNEPNTITVDSVKSLFKVSVHRVLEVYSCHNLSNLFAEAERTMLDRRCRIYFYHE